MSKNVSADLYSNSYVFLCNLCDRPHLNSCYCKTGPGVVDLVCKVTPALCALDCFLGIFGYPVAFIVGANGKTGFTKIVDIGPDGPWADIELLFEFLAVNCLITTYMMLFKIIVEFLLFIHGFPPVGCQARRSR